MSSGGWQQVAPPDVDSRAAQAWGWEIHRLAELTRARQDLRARLAARRLPDVAGTEDVDRLLLMFE